MNGNDPTDPLGPPAPGAPVVSGVPPMPGATPPSLGSEWSDLPSWSAPVAPTPAPPRKRRWPLVVGVAVVLVAVAVIVAMVSGGGSTLPSTLSGSERVDSGPIADMMDSLSKMEVAGIKFDVAAYGGGLTPDYLVMLIDGQIPGNDPTTFMSAFGSGFAAQGGGTLDMDHALSEQVGDTEYVCAPTTGATTPGMQDGFSVCAFIDQDVSGIVMGFRSDDLHRLLDSTKELHDAVA